MARQPSSFLPFSVPAPRGAGVVEASVDAGLGGREEAGFSHPHCSLPGRLTHSLSPPWQVASAKLGFEGDRTSPRGANNRVIIQRDETELSGAS